MKKRVSQLVKNVARRMYSFVTWDQWCYRSWSQEGEDLVLRKIFEQHQTGFYVDVGAHHPRRYSNTQFFYRRGWHGINIDAMPGSMEIFSKMRPRDLNIEVGIGQEEGKLEYYIFNEPALNSFSKDLSKDRHEAQTNKRIKDVVEVNVKPLSCVFDQHLPKDQSIDFISIDVEGMDFDVLKSNDWSKYRPAYVLVEVLRSSLHEIESTQIGELMKSVGYVIFAKCANTVFFKDLNQQ